MKNPYNVVRDFEQAVAEYTGAPYCVAVNSCTAALTLAVAWCLERGRASYAYDWSEREHVEIPSRTYQSVPMAIIRAGGRPAFRDEEWLGAYQLKPLPVWDSARWFSKGMYSGLGAKAMDETGLAFDCFGAGQMVCTSHHWSKTLGIQQGGCILLDDPEADAWLRRARFDGRTEGVAPKNDKITMVGWHCYMSPEVAAEGLVRLHFLPRHNAPLLNDEYPDLSQLEIFR